MKILSKTLMLATVSAALLGPALLAIPTQAQTFTYSPNGDLLLDFRETTGSYTATSLTIDLGSFANLGANFTEVNGVVNLNQFAPYITATYGNLNNLDWSVGGQDSSFDEWMTRTRNPSSPNYGNPAINGSTPWTQYSGTVLSSSANEITGTGNSAAGATATVLANQVATDSTVGHRYQDFVGASGNWSGHFQGDVESSTGASFTGSAIQEEDLYALTAGGSGPGTYLGYFELGANDTLEFVVAPEPMTYGLLAGLGLLVVSLRQQIRRLRA